ncbi:hypothetical protein O203_21355 [Ectopseudomonas chengduensis]|nr:hypothetical protein O203_21355 [Pseudomonas chengduensis]
MIVLVAAALGHNIECLEMRELILPANRLSQSLDAGKSAGERGIRGMAHVFFSAPCCKRHPPTLLRGLEKIMALSLMVYR